MTENNLFKPTLMQKLLGRNYKLYYSISQGFKSNMIYRYNSIAWLLSSIVLVFGTLTVWYINLNNNQNLTDFKYIFTYFVIGESFILNTSIQFNIGEDIEEGKFTNKLLLPTSFFQQYISRQFGHHLFENLAKMFLYLSIALILNQFFIISTFINLILFLILAGIAYFINIFIGMIVGASAFWLTTFFGCAAFFDNLKLVISGRYFPLNSLKFLTPLIYTPFAFTFYHPMQIYLGKYSPVEIIYVFAGGIFWCFALYFLAKWVFKLGLKRNEAVGL